MFGRLLLRALAPLAALLAQPGLAQSAPDIAGDWNGTLSTPQTDLRLVIHVARAADGALKATVENYDQNPGNRVDITEIAVTGNHLSWKVAPIGATFQGDWDAASQTWKGTFNQGAALPMALVKGVPPPKPVVAGLDGAWVGTIEANGVRLRQVFTFRTTEAGTFGLYSSPDQLANGVVMSDLKREGQAITLSTAHGAARFAGTLSADGQQLTGAWSTPGQPDRALTLTRASEAQLAAVRNPNRPQTPKPPFPYKAEDVAFSNPALPEVHLAGTLTLPEGPGPFPAAVLITGSGAQDRDETMLDHKPFAVIADHLTRHGFAVLRFDDRATGKSTGGDYGAATSADLATDANAAFAYLMTRPEIRHDRVGFIGHSEGGMIGPIAMASNDKAAFLVMLAGPGTALDQLMLSQRRLIVSQMGAKEEDIDRAEPVLASVFKAIREAPTPQAGRDAAMALMTPEAKEAVGLPRDADGGIVVNQVSGPWFSYFLRYDPAPNLARIKVPILALNGSLDRQVPPAANLAAIRAATRGNPDVTTTQLPGLNHLFQPATTGAVGEYRDIETTVAPAALDAMTEWLTRRFGGR
jgi:pimeloyl-ACP methyl ester carboxylesterase